MWQNIAFVAAGLVAAAGIGGLAASLGSTPVQIVVTQFSTDAEGRDQLNLMCAGCPDDSTIELDGARASVHAEKAVLLPSRPVQVGRNELNFEVKNSAGEALDAKPVILPIAYRQHSSWKGQHDIPPFAEVIVEAPPGSEVRINDEVIPLEGATAIYRSDVGSLVEGEKSQPEAITLAIPISVTAAGKTRTAQATLKNTVTPLRLTSVGRLYQAHGDTLTIQGLSSPGATVRVGAKQVQANKHGTFSVTLESVTPGKLTVAAYDEKLVARHLEIEIVKSIPIPKDVTTRFDKLEPGARVNLSANVLESRVTQGVTRALVEVQNGCEQAPCLIPVVAPEPISLRPNRRVRVYGDVVSADPLTVRAIKFH